MAIRTPLTSEQAGRAFLEQSLDGRTAGLTAVVVPAGAAPLTVLPAALREDVVSLWHAPSDRSFVGAGVAAALELDGGDRWRQLRDGALSAFADLQVVLHPDAELLRPAIVGGLGFAAGWADEPWERFGDGSFVLHRWTYERAERPTLTLTADLSALDAAARSRLLSEYDRIVDALGDAADDALFPTPEPASDGFSDLSLRQLPMPDWIAHVRLIQRELEHGTFAKLVAARRCDARLDDGVDAMTIVARMAHDFPKCTAFVFQRGERAFVGATPETLFTNRGRRVSSQALAGSLQAAADETGAARREDLLAHSRKNLGEHDVVVRAVVAALADHCVTVEHPPQPEVVRVNNLIHLSTPISGELREGVHPVDILESLHPTPAVGGVPRQDSISWIVEHERSPRGWYTGPIGWIDTAGDATFRVAIRCGLLEPNAAHVYTGAGIVADSNPAAEYHETSLKQRPFLRALCARA